MNLTWECGTPRSTNNAFGILYEPRAVADSYPTRKKTGPKRTKQERAAIALETLEERKERQLRERRECHQRTQLRKKAERVNPYSDTGRSTGPTKSEIAPR